MNGKARFFFCVSLGFFIFTFYFQNRINFPNVRFGSSSAQGYKSPFSTSGILSAVNPRDQNCQQATWRVGEKNIKIQTALGCAGCFKYKPPK